MSQEARPPVDAGQAKRADDDSDARVSAWILERLWLAPWALLIAAPLLLRGPLPPDELRYLSVAWEMWSSGDLLVPHLNGVPYSDKPPLLFWLMHAGWTVLGVNAWWPRILPGFFALTAALTTQALGRALWRDRSAGSAVIPWMLFGTFAWSLYSQVILFDLLLVNWTLLGLLGIVRAESGEKPGWSIVAVAIGLGLLTKGPAMLLHLAGPALLAPWWARPMRVAIPRWYGRLAVALAVGSLLALAWAIPAAMSGGESYAREILLGQTAGRLVASFAHARPFWYYIFIFPLLMFPWSCWPAAWRAIRRGVMAAPLDRGWRLLLSAMVPAFIAFSAISGKQPHYLLPLVPLVVLLVAHSLPPALDERARVSARLPALLAAIGAVTFGCLPLLPVGGTNLTVAPWSPIWGIAAGLVIFLLARPGSWPTAVRRLALAMPIFVVASEAAFFGANAADFDPTPTATEVSQLRNAGFAVAHIGEYDGELHFPGRLQAPLEIVEASDVAAWAATHPGGYVVGKFDTRPESALYVQRLRGDWLAIRRAADLPQSE